MRRFAPRGCLGTETVEIAPKDPKVAERRILFVKRSAVRAWEKETTYVEVSLSAETGRDFLRLARFEHF